jgi:hypothetical protein
VRCGARMWASSAANALPTINVGASSWGYTRIRGALKNVGHRVARSTIARWGKRHFRRAIHEFVEHYHSKRNHQGLDNELIDGHPSPEGAGRIRRRPRLGGLLNYYYRAS